MAGTKLMVQQLSWIVLVCITGGCLVGGTSAATSENEAYVIADPVVQASPQYITCTAPCQCMEPSDILRLYGADGYVRCDDRPCGESEGQGLANVAPYKYCVKKKPVTAVPVVSTTTQVPGPVRMQAQDVPARYGVQPEGGQEVVVPALEEVPGKFQVPAQQPGSLMGPPKSAVDAFLAQGNRPHAMNFTPLEIHIGDKVKSPLMRTDSPYYRYQFKSPDSSPQGQIIDRKLTIPTSYLEVDSSNTRISSYVVSGSSSEKYWGDQSTIKIDKNSNYDNPVSFRWTAWNPDNCTDGIWQVSSYQFPTNSEKWENQFIPGLAGSGPVRVQYEKNGFDYFEIPFGKIANKYPGDPPFYDGVGMIDETIPGQGRPMDLLMRIPVLSGGLYSKKVNIGGFTLPIPAGYQSIPAGEKTEKDLGNLNQNMVLSTGLIVRNATAFESVFMAGPQTYYVRVVPICEWGGISGPKFHSGVPTIPVEVTIERPIQCPPLPTTPEIQYLRPPSVKFVSFYHNNLQGVNPDVEGARYTSISVPAGYDPNTDYLAEQGYWVGQYNYCNAKGSSDDTQQLEQCMADISPPPPSEYVGFQTFAHGQVDYHFTIPPREKDWMDTLFDTLKSVFAGFVAVIDAISEAWNLLQDYAVKALAYVVQYHTYGLFDCNNSDACKIFLKTSLQTAMTSCGIPPTIPNFSELERMGTDYLIKITAEQLGADGVLDAGKEIYKNLPPSVQDTLNEKADAVAKGMVDQVTESVSSDTAKAANSWYTWDPLIYEPHPAIMVTKVFNPNSEPTNVTNLIITDSNGLFKGKAIIPSLKPGQSVIVPVMLYENLNMSSQCVVATNGIIWTTNSAIPTCDKCEECYLWDWLIRYQKNHEDTFHSSFAAMGKQGTYIEGLDESYSDGKTIKHDHLISICNNGVYPLGSGKIIYKYPDNWKISTDTRQENIDIFGGFQFTEGDQGLMITS